MYIDGNFLNIVAGSVLAATVVINTVTLTLTTRTNKKVELAIKNTNLKLRDTPKKPNKAFEEALIPLDFLINNSSGKHFSSGLIPLSTVSDNNRIKDKQIDDIVEKVAFDTITTLSKDARADLSYYIDDEILDSFITERIYMNVLSESVKYNNKALKSKRK